MIDFFSEFTLDSEFGGAGVGGFSLDIPVQPSDEDATDGTHIDKPVTAEEIKDLTSTDDIQEGDVFWAPNEDQAVEGDLGNVKITGMTKQTADNGATYFTIALEDITALEFTGQAEVTLSNDVSIDATRGFNLGVDNGTITGGSFAGGVGTITITAAPANAASYLSDDGATTIAITGMSTEAVNWTADNNDVRSIVTAGNPGGKITVTGDTRFTIGTETAQETFRLANADLATPVTFRYDSEDGSLILDLSAVEADGGTLNLSGAGGATQVIPPINEETIRIASSTYTYETQGDSYFVLGTDGAVDGFAFGDDGDFIRLTSGEVIAFYDADDGASLPFNDNVTTTGDYVVTRTADGYSASIYESATVVSDTNADEVLTFSIDTRLEVPVVVYFDQNGGIISVDALENLADGDTMTVEGAVATSTTSGLAIGAPDAIEGYIAVDSGEFTFTGGDDDVTVELGDTVYASNGYDVLQLDSDNDIVYNSDGTVTALGTTNSYGGYTYTGETDGRVTFTLDANGDVAAVTGLNDGVITGDFRNVTVNGVAIDTTDPVLAVTGGTDTITAISGFDYGTLTLEAAKNGLAINGSAITFSSTSIDLAADSNGSVTVTSGITSGDTVTGADSTIFTFVTTGGTDVFTVNDKVYTVNDDLDGVISISGAGVVTGLDEEASLAVDEGPVTVNGAAYTAEQVARANLYNEDIVGYSKKSGDVSSYMTDLEHPLLDSNDTPADVMNKLTLGTNVDTVVYETDADSAIMDYSKGTDRVLAYMNTDGVRSLSFNDKGQNVAVVTALAEDSKVITLGAKGDAVIMDGANKDGQVNVIGGAGADTLVVTGSMPVTFDMSKGGADRVHTFAAANGLITLDGYDESSGAGIVVHDPEIQNVTELDEAIQDGLLMFGDGRILAIDRDEETNGADRITEIKVNNKTSAHQTMVRLFGYKDNQDSYRDDAGQLVGFTGATGGTLDASDIAESVVLIGNKDNNKLSGSLLKTGVYNDTVFAGAMDTIDTGDGVDTIILDDTADRGAATIIVGRGAGDAVENLHTGFDGDIFDVTSFDGKLDYTFTEGTLAIVDNSSKSTLAAVTDETGQFVKQRFINGSDTLYAAVASEGGTITVTDSDATVPNYYLAKDGAIDFSAYSGYVGIDVDGEDLDYPSAIESSSVSIGSSVNSLIGGTGTTIFKGGKGNETLVAGTGESSLYGGGGQNILIGENGSVKSGSTEFFVIGIHNGAQNTITGFEFIENGATNQATFDNLNLGMGDGNEVIDLKANSDGSVSIAVKGAESGATEKATIAGAAGNEFLVDRGTDTETVAQIAASENTINNSYVDFYAATEKNATVKIGDVTSAKVWLEAPDYSDGVEFVGDYTVIDARTSGASVEMAGNNVANTIYGGLGNASMWGGAGSANDVMYGGTAHNEFYYEVGNGDDTIMSANNGDIIHLGATLDQVNFDGTQITSSGIVVKFNDGGTLSINSSAEVSFSFDDGTSVRANRQTQQFE